MTTPNHGHTHSVDLDAFLELVNSLEYDDGRPDEHLRTPAEAADFLAAHGAAHADALQQASADDRTAERQLRRLRQVRAAAREVWDALVEGRDADPAAIERVNEALRHRPLIELTPDRDGCGVGHRHVGDPWDEALARLLEPFVESVAEGQADRFRICANDGCRWVFFDEPATRCRYPISGNGARNAATSSGVPTGWFCHLRARPFRSNIASNTRRASSRESRMMTVPTPVVRSISAGSRPTFSQCSRRIASLRFTFSIPPPTLFASA
jgi:predicted RNA-binding Zn ribbon-like protein